MQSFADSGLIAQPISTTIVLKMHSEGVVGSKPLPCRHVAVCGTECSEPCGVLRRALHSSQFEGVPLGHCGHLLRPSSLHAATAQVLAGMIGTSGGRQAHS